MIKWSSSPWSLNFEIAWLALSPTVLGQDFLPRVSFSSYSLFSLAELPICRMSVNLDFFMCQTACPWMFASIRKRENIQPSKGRREFQVCNKMSSKAYFLFSVSVLKLFPYTYLNLHLWEMAPSGEALLSLTSSLAGIQGKQNGLMVFFSFVPLWEGAYGAWSANYGYRIV